MHFCWWPIDIKSFDLHGDVDSNDKEGIDEADQEPDLHRFDAGGVGQGGGHGQVDGGEHHHAGDVHSDDQIVLVRDGQVVRGLVDDVHQDGW